MYLSAGLSLALLSTATNIACGFSMKPHNTKNFVNLHKDLSLVKPMSIHQSPFNQMNVIDRVRGGSIAASSADVESESSGGIGNKVASLWAAGGVVMILAKSIKRILPIALEPFAKGAAAPLSTFQLG